MRSDHFLTHQAGTPNNGEPYFGEAAPNLFGSLPLWLFAFIGATIGAVAFAMVWGIS